MNTRSDYKLAQWIKDVHLFSNIIKPSPGICLYSVWPHSLFLCNEMVWCIWSLFRCKTLMWICELNDILWGNCGSIWLVYTDHFSIAVWDAFSGNNLYVKKMNFCLYIDWQHNKTDNSTQYSVYEIGMIIRILSSYILFVLWTSLIDFFLEISARKRKNCILQKQS